MYFLRIVLFCLAWGLISTEVTSDKRDNVLWGCSSHYNDTSIRQFRVIWSDTAIADLRYRLNNARAPTPSITKTFEYGFNSDIVKIWTNYWANEYDFTARQKYLNKFPQYITTIQGLDIHFVWVKPKVTCDCEIKPVLILHGYPSSVAEYYKLISEIRNRGCVNGVALAIVAASMPGHYYSSAPNKPGCGAIEMATILKNLMLRLGYSQFYVHSNDCVHVDSMIATIYPEAVLGLHTTNPITFSPFAWALWFTGALSTSLIPVLGSEYKNRMYPVSEKITKIMNDFSTIHVLATRPDTLGIALSDTPSGLLAHELLFASWLNHPDNTKLHDGGLFDQFERDVVLDEITVYWFENCIITAGRIFAESLNWRTFETGLYSKQTPVPTWAVIPEHNYLFQSPVQLQLKYPNLLGTETLECSGHYPAYEQPKLTADSLFNFIALATKWHVTNDPIC